MNLNLSIPLEIISKSFPTDSHSKFMFWSSAAFGKVEESNGERDLEMESPFSNCLELDS